MAAASMFQGRMLVITVAEAQLVRIFDSLKQSQDVFVQLVCMYPDGSEKVVGRTETCKGGNFFPRWNEQFRTTRGKGKSLKFRIFVDHLWRSATLCGEAEVDLDNLWSRGMAGSAKVPVPLFKKSEQTGVLCILLEATTTGEGAPSLGACAGAVHAPSPAPAPAALLAPGPAPGPAAAAAAARPRLPEGQGYQGGAAAGARLSGPSYRGPLPAGRVFGDSFAANGAYPQHAGAGMAAGGAGVGAGTAAAAIQQSFSAGAQGGLRPPMAGAAAGRGLDAAEPRQQQSPPVLTGPGGPCGSFGAAGAAAGAAGAGARPAGPPTAPTYAPAVATGASGQWWNSFIDRG
eukprot:TRINITY_DN26132_c0_g1_i1.p1 TRINITY_DN26132_c0_g1~~TRINITY_DN26132_c0_g1_i1.p1  ORF type:complete len:345 (-),score=77.97 TRINITY_DN26132_c0_g1_i1:42-1076(-)